MGEDLWCYKAVRKLCFINKGTFEVWIQVCHPEIFIWKDYTVFRIEEDWLAFVWHTKTFAFKKGPFLAPSLAVLPSSPPFLPVLISTSTPGLLKDGHLVWGQMLFITRVLFEFDIRKVFHCHCNWVSLSSSRAPAHITMSEHLAAVYYPHHEEDKDELSFSVRGSKWRRRSSKAFILNKEGCYRDIWLQSRQTAACVRFGSAREQEDPWVPHRLAAFCASISSCTQQVQKKV